MALSVFVVTTQAQQQLPPAWSGSANSIQFDNRTRAYLSPVRVLWTQATDDASLSDVENLLKPGNGQSMLGASNLCHMKNGKTGRASILLDFGRELQGGIQIVTGTSASRNIQVRLRFGESASEAMCEIDGKNGATNDHAIRDLTFALPWLGVAEYGNTGFRFVRIDLLGENTDMLLKEVRASFVYRDIPYKGSFQCDNELLNKIWMTGAYTVQLNMQGFMWDGVKRDRLVWIGDMNPEIMTINSVFGYNEVVPKSLDLAKEETPLPKWMDGISSYSIWWLLDHYKWYYYQGNKKYLLEQKAYIIPLLEQLISKIDKDGKETLDSRFLDWPSSENEPGIHAGLQALMVIAMDAGQEVSTILGDPAMAAKCKEAAARLRKVIPDCNNSKQGASLLALAGMMDAKKAVNDVIGVGGAKNFSTFYGYYMLEAMSMAGDYQDAMDRICEYWGAMLDLGATTFWEDFNLDWMKNAARIDELVPEGKVDIHKSYGNYCYKGYRHSLSHGWASGPTAWLSEHVLGVKVLKPGCQVVLIEPHLGNLKWVKGSFPTPYGIIKISHKKDANGKVVSTINAPKAIKIIRR